MIKFFTRIAKALEALPKEERRRVINALTMLYRGEL